jgi:glutathione S-transferase
MGKDLSLADIAIMPVIVRADDIDLGHLWAGHPAVAAWLENIRATEAFPRTYYHGSLLTEQYPQLRNLKARGAAA